MYICSNCNQYSQSHTAIPSNSLVRLVLRLQFKTGVYCRVQKISRHLFKTDFYDFYISIDSTFIAHFKIRLLACSITHVCSFEINVCLILKCSHQSCLLIFCRMYCIWIEYCIAGMFVKSLLLLLLFFCCYLLICSHFWARIANIAVCNYD